MEIHYCAECSCRIEVGDERFADGTAYCANCYQKKFPRASKTTIRPAGRRSTPARAVSKPSTEHLPKPAAGAIEKTGAHRAPSVRVQREAPKSSGTLVVIGVVCAVVVIVLLLYVMLSSKEDQPRRTTDDAHTSAAKKEPEPNSNATATSKTAADPMQELREGLARKDYDALVRDERDGRLTGTGLRKALNDFIERYGSTTAGRDASSKLEKLPPATPEVTPSENTQSRPGTTPATGPAGVLYGNTFENDAGFKDIAKGERAPKGGFDAPGSSVASVADKGSWFTSRIDLRFQDRAPVVQLDSWIRFAVYIEDGEDQICCHSGIGDGVYERYVKSLPRKKWAWVTFRMADYTKNLKTGKAEKPVPGTQFQMTAIFGCSKTGKPTRIYVDDFSIGNGPVP